MQPSPQADEVRDELVAAFDIPPSFHLSQPDLTWKSTEAPYWWKWRWSCPIPKNTDDNSLAGQRPIILVEVVRKTWLAFVIHRINACWNKYDILHPPQHGFRTAQGTD